MTGRRVLVITALVVLAGCSGPLGPFFGGNDGSPSLPPGVTEDGVNGTRLLEAHRAALANQSFTVETSGSVAGAETGQQVRVGANDTAVVGTITPSVTIIVVDGRQYERIDGPRGVEYTVTNWSRGGQTVHEAYAEPTALRIALDPSSGVTGNLTLNGTVERDGRTLWRLTVEPRGVTEGDAPNGTVLVTPAGRVVSAQRTLVTGGNRVAVSATFSAVGGTTVTTPDWVADARRHGEYEGFRDDQRRVTDPVPLGYSGDSRGLVTLVGVPGHADSSDLDVGPIATADDPLSDAIVGWYAYVETSTDHDHAYVTLGYNESRLPANASESELALYRLGQNSDTFERLDGSADADENEVSARVDDAAGIYVVFHTPTFERLRDELETEN
ncbi:hypothetical protein [Halobacterium zhouii]|uniref:hypothetical protein n=1 Tax=Halobacterium zhouii TaxID=2902624 RepID=UPI001E300DBD|nr:hypothetical protein [Halobacterium zhouii]